MCQNPPEKVIQAGFEKLQITLVDCPGHASLIRTIIGGAQIIDMMLPVIDVTKVEFSYSDSCSFPVAEVVHVWAKGLLGKLHSWLPSLQSTGPKENTVAWEIAILIQDPGQE